MQKMLPYPAVKLFRFLFFFLSIVVSSNAQFTDSVALFVVADNAAMTVAENAIADRLTGMGFTVATAGQSAVNDAAAEGASIILISATVSSGTVATNMPGLKDLEIPIINWEPALYDDLGFQEIGGGEFSTTDIEIINDTHPLAGGLPAAVISIATAAKAVSYGSPQGDAVVIAVNSADTSQVVLFGYDKGAAMFSGNAAARRIGTFLLNDVADGMTEDGWTLFDASVIWAMGGGGATAVGHSDNVPLQFALHNNYPNPFNPATTISYSIPVQTNVRLGIFNMLGVEVETLVDEIKPAGNYTAKFHAHGISSGIYFYRLEAGAMVATRKLLFLK